jgi:hypothetical protein
MGSASQTPPTVAISAEPTEPIRGGQDSDPDPSEFLPWHTLPGIQSAKSMGTLCGYVDISFTQLSTQPPYAISDYRGYHGRFACLSSWNAALTTDHERRRRHGHGRAYNSFEINGPSRTTSTNWQGKKRGHHREEAYFHGLLGGLREVPQPDSGSSCTLSTRLEAFFRYFSPLISFGLGGKALFLNGWVMV